MNFKPTTIHTAWFKRYSRKQISHKTTVASSLTLVFTALLLFVWAIRHPRSHSVIIPTSRISALDQYDTLMKVHEPEPGVLSRYTGFILVCSTENSLIYPDLSHQTEFRTSQLAIFNGKTYPSRKVFYESSSKPRGVVVLAMDAYQKPEALKQVLEERKRFCAENNYGLFARYTQDFAADDKPFWESMGLSQLRMMRQAMHAFPHSEWFWYFSTHGHIKAIDQPMLPLLNNQYGSLRLAMDTRGTDVGIESFARTPDRAMIVLSLDPDNLESISSGSIMVKRSLPTQVFLDILTDPLIQDYERFKTAKDHAGIAIAHLVRWHPLLASSIAVVSPRWSGVQPCEDSLDRDLACSYKADSDWT